MFRKSRMREMLRRWEAFLAYGGERPILEALRSAPKDRGFLDFVWHVTPIFEGCLPHAVQNEYKSRDAIPSRNEREKGIADLRLQVHRKLDDTVWPYLWSAMQSFKCKDMYQVFIDARGFTTNYYSTSDEFQLLSSFCSFAKAITSGERPRYINHNLCSIVREGNVKVATLSVGTIFSIPFHYSNPNTVQADVKKWQLPNSSRETCIYNKKVTWGTGGTWTPVVEGFEAFYAASPQQWNAHVHVEALYDTILEAVPIPFAETLQSYMESDFDGG